MNKKKYMVIVAMATITILGWKDSAFESSKLTLINNSSLYIDSTIFFVNNYKIKIDSILPMSMKIKTIYSDSIQLNKHDIIVRAELYVGDSIFRRAYNYNDLYGGLASGYRLLLKADYTIQLVEEN